MTICDTNTYLGVIAISNNNFSTLQLALTDFDELINQIEFTLYFYTFVEGIIEKLLQCRKKTMYYLVLYHVPTYLTKVYLPRYEISTGNSFIPQENAYLSIYLYLRTIYPKVFSQNDGKNVTSL